ncbi:MAG TPA: tripartite tricarboxylate transporter substrate binding protein [Acetobacteraceae bacterium]|nr:tripartite tricarboxylate transporter substrate binding protein [Acetobacteraceae bacterium]
MRVARRHMLGTAVAAVAAFATVATVGAVALGTRPAFAQGAWPERPIRFIVPLTAGGTADILARLIAENLTMRLGRPVVVENRPGAGGAIGMEAVARAAPDGYTIGMGNIAANAILPAVNRSRTPYDPVRDFTPITLGAVTPSVLVVNPQKVPVTDLAGFLAFLRANPDRLNFGSSGIGTSLHLGMEMLMAATDTRMTHVPFRGSSEMITALVSGQVDLALDGWPTSLPHIQAGRLRAIAVPTPARLPFAPELPAIAEQVPGVGLSPWHGVMGPAGLPPAITARLSEEIGAILRRPDLVERLAGMGVLAEPGTPEQFRSLMEEEVVRFRTLVERVGISAQ